MYQSLELFQTASAMASHAGKRQAVVARNIANADTPNYRAQDLVPFKDIVQTGTTGRMRTTRPSHLGNAAVAAQTTLFTENTSEPSPNGNSVSLEEEMLNSVNISRDHNRALAIYRHTMTVLRTSLGKA